MDGVISTLLDQVLIVFIVDKAPPSKKKNVVKALSQLGTRQKEDRPYLQIRDQGLTIAWEIEV